MERKEFLALLGSGAASVVFAACMGGCSKKEDDPSPNNPGTSNKKDFTLDLNAPANAALQTNGGHLVTNEVIVAKTSAGNYIAVASVCTHQGGQITFESPNNQFYCPVHGSKFALDGKVVNGPAATALKQYKTSLTGTMLRIFE
ncbi:(2Fe-2S)-binding protein [Adhaeribacter arboris]|uniref:(2Fe-2S)-binding protein n=1 Tax=Adhaeribacter arboris TaxID=2072846 RepID=A0A2T2YB92_9BACT|nr:Rieske (2Fe-2S) protein [Adhaeribacter arboris]PSR52800.1 (2Fe-2S)-binding protein [Adhaeribacter arboris]